MRYLEVSTVDLNETTSCCVLCLQEKTLTHGMVTALKGSAEHLSTALKDAEFIYLRSPGYDGADVIQVLKCHS